MGFGQSKPKAAAANGDSSRQRDEPKADEWFGFGSYGDDIAVRLGRGDFDPFYRTFWSVTDYTPPPAVAGAGAGAAPAGAGAGGASPASASDPVWIGLSAAVLKGVHVGFNEASANDRFIDRMPRRSARAPAVFFENANATTITGPTIGAYNVHGDRAPRLEVLYTLSAVKQYKGVITIDTRNAPPKFDSRYGAGDADADADAPLSLVSTTGGTDTGSTAKSTKKPNPNTAPTGDTPAHQLMRAWSTPALKFAIARGRNDNTLTVTHPNGAVFHLTTNH